MVRAMAKKQRIKKACIQEVMRLRRMERWMERMKTKMRKAWGNKEEDEGSSQHPIEEDFQEILPGVVNKAVEEAEKKQGGLCQVSASAQVIFHFCCLYQIYSYS